MAVLATVVTAFKSIGLAALKAAIRSVASGMTRIGAAGLRSMAALATKVAGVAAALKSLSIAASIGIVKSSVEDTVASFRQLKQIASLTKMPPEFVDFWVRMGAGAGIDRDDLNGIFSGFASAASEAAADVDSEFAKTFRELGVQVTDAQGRMRNLSHIFGDLAINSAKISPALRGFRLNQIFGDDDALKVSRLLDNIAAKGADASNAEFRALKASGSLVTDDQLKEMDRLLSYFGAFKSELTVIKRLIAVGVAPALEDALNAATDLLFKNRKVISEYFTQLSKAVVDFGFDVSKVFFGFDLARAFGNEQTQIRFTWLEPLKRGLDQAFEIAKILGKGLVGLTKAADKVFARVTGFSFIDFFGDLDADGFARLFEKGLDYARRFILDLGTIFTGGVDFETGLGEWLNGALDKAYEAVSGFITRVRADIEAVVGYVRTAFAEIQGALSLGGSTDGLTTSLAVVVVSIVDVATAVSTLVEQFRKVFILGQDADAGFEWIDNLHTVLDSALGTLTTFVKVMQTVFAPLQAIVSLFGDWSAIGVILAVEVLFGIANALTGGLLGAAVTKGVTALIGALTGPAGLAGSFGAIGAAIGTMALPLAAFIATAAAAAIAVKGIYNALPESWKTGLVDTLGTSDATMKKRFFDLKTSMDADLDRFGVKPGAVDTYRQRYGTPVPLGQLQTPAPAANLNLQPVQINIAGAPPIGASMTGSQLDDARAYALRSTSR